MMNRKEIIALAIVGMGLLAAVMTMSSPTQVALALGHWNLDEDYTPNSGFAEDGKDSSGTTDNAKGEEEHSDEDSITAYTNEGRINSESVAYQEFERCLSDNEGEHGDLADNKMQECYESNFGGKDNIRNTPTG